MAGMESSMNKLRPVVIRPERSNIESVIPRLEPRLFFDRDGRWAGWAGRIQNEAGNVSSWHLHPASDTFVCIIRGSIRIDFGVNGAESLEATAGDFFFIPARTIHRESTARDSDLDALVFRLGQEPEQVDVEGPERSD
jgi:uncharacterized RmlC-like cupin family protein